MKKEIERLIALEKEAKDNLWHIKKQIQKEMLKTAWDKDGVKSGMVVKRNGEEFKVVEVIPGQYPHIPESSLRVLRKKADGKWGRQIYTLYNSSGR